MLIPKKWREFSALLSANSLSMVGNSLTMIAIPWFVFNLTGSATVAAAVVFAGQLPNILVGLFSGHFIDRFSAKKVSLFSDAVNFFAVLSIPVLYSVDMLNMVLLSTLVFLSQVLDSPGSTARRVLVPELIDKHGLPRERANGIDSLVETGADIIGPAIAGVLIAVIGELFLLVFDAITFLCSFFIILVGVQSKVRTTHEPVVQPIRSVWAWMFQQRQILKLAMYDTIINAVATPLLALTLPIYAQSLGESAAWLGLWMACFAIGTTLTTAAYTVVGHRLSPLWLLRLTPIGQSLAMAFIALAIYFPWSPICLAIGLFFFGMNLGVGSMVDAIVLQKQVPADRRGTVFAAFSSMRYLGVPVGLALSGLVIDQIGFTTLFIIFSACLIVPSLLWVKTKQLVG